MIRFYHTQISVSYFYLSYPSAFSFLKAGRKSRTDRQQLLHHHVKMSSMILKLADEVKMSRSII